MSKTNKSLIILVVGMGLLILMGITALIVGFVLKANNTNFSLFKRNNSTVIKQPMANDSIRNKIDVVIPNGFRIIDYTLNDQTLLLFLENGSGSQRIMAIDSVSGSTLKYFEIRNQN